MTDRGNKTFPVELLETQDAMSALRHVAFVLAGTFIISTGIYLSNGNPAWGNFARNSILGMALSLVLLLIVKAKKTKIAVYIMLVVNGAWLSYLAWDGAGVQGTAFPMLVLVVIGAELFIGKRVGYLTAGIAFLMGVTLLLAGRAGWLVNLERPITDIAALINASITFFIAAQLIRLAIDRVERALARAQDEIEERNYAEDEIRHLNLELENKVEIERHTGNVRQRLLDFSRELLATVDMSEILEIIRRTANELVAHDVFSPYWLDEEAAVLRPIETQGRQWFSNAFYQEWTIPLGQGIIGDAARRQQAECVNNSHLDPRAIYPPEVGVQITQEHSIVLPIRSEEKMIGMLLLLRRADPPFTQDEFELAQLLMSLAELALNHARMFSDLEQRVASRTAELAASNKRYQNFIEKSAEGIWLLSFYEPIPIDLPSEEQVARIQESGYIAECNEALAKMYGYSSREELIGKNLLNDLYGGLATEVNNQSTLRLVREGYRSSDRLTEEVNEKGERVYFMNNAVGEIQDGHLIGVWGIQRDVTKLRQIEAEREKYIAELKNKNDELERFTYTVSHDLKAPLITIRGFLGYLEEDIQAADHERVKSDMEHILRATNRMQTLLDELLELSRAGRMLNPPEAVSFETIVHDAVHLVMGGIDAQGVHLEIASGLPTVYGDRTRLTQVLQNLVDNAVKFMGDQPKPRVEIGQQGTDPDGHPVFFVRDNGIGIAPEFQERIFGLFNKLDPQAEGTGIGLALVKRIIETHGGRIWVESEGLGKGSTFLFTIPSHHFQRSISS